MPNALGICGTMYKVKTEEILFFGELWLPSQNARTRVRVLYLIAFFVGYVVVYFNFSVAAVFVAQLAKQNWLFSEFLPKIIRENSLGKAKFSVKNLKTDNFVL